MKKQIELPTFGTQEELILTHVSEKYSGYGHRTITAELEYRGETNSFSHTTNDMPSFDKAKGIKGYEERQLAYFGLIDYQIEDAIVEWTQNIDYDKE